MKKKRILSFRRKQHQHLLHHHHLHHSGRRFRNPFPGYKKRNFIEFLRWMIVRGKGRTVKKWRYFSFEAAETDGALLRSDNGNLSLTWIGHSTVLVRLDGLTILTDPIWSDRASPLPWAGPKRYTRPGVEFDDIPDVDVVLISHDHYDHLDKATLKRLGNAPLYFVPLGVGKLLRRYGISNYVELDWWESATYQGVSFSCTPAQHFSGRGVFDQNRRLWCGWAVKGENGSFFFAGDTGYFPGFREIGDRFGPFDVACVSIGAYLPRWFMSPVHLNPGEAVKAWEELRGNTLMAIHWGTFTLADDPPSLPLTEIRHQVLKGMIDNDRCWIPKHGETRVMTSDTGR